MFEGSGSGGISGEEEEEGETEVQGDPKSAVFQRPRGVLSQKGGMGAWNPK